MEVRGGGEARGVADLPKNTGYYWFDTFLPKENNIQNKLILTMQILFYVGRYVCKKIGNVELHQLQNAVKFYVTPLGFRTHESSTTYS
jgi:hypothetical protein